MRIAHFIDINLLIKLTEKAWIVSKEKPNYPIMVISKNDFKLFKSGIYKSQGNLVKFNGKEFWLPDEVYNKIKVLVAKKKIDITKLAISLRPIHDAELLASQPYEFDFSILDSLKNKPDDIYIISKENPQSSLVNIMEEFLEEVKALGLSIKNVYYISEIINNYDNYDITYRTQKILLQHSIGFKSDMDVLTTEEIDSYDKIMYYSNSYDTLNYPIETNHILDDLYHNSPDNIKRVIRDEFMYLKPIIVANKYSSNIMNNINSSKSVLKLNNIMSFESFKYNESHNSFFTIKKEDEVDLYHAVLKNNFSTFEELMHSVFKNGLIPKDNGEVGNAIWFSTSKEYADDDRELSFIIKYDNINRDKYHLTIDKPNAWAYAQIPFNELTINTIPVMKINGYYLNNKSAIRFFSKKDTDSLAKWFKYESPDLIFYNKIFTQTVQPFCNIDILEFFKSHDKNYINYDFDIYDFNKIKED